MKKKFKQVVVITMVLSLFLFGAVTAQAEWIFGNSFMKSFSLTLNELYQALSMTAVDNTAFQLMRSGCIYAWDPDQNVYSLYAQVTARPVFDAEIPFSSQSDSLRRELTETVSCLIPSDQGLYGFNDISGMIGLIDRDGWHVQEARMDTSALRVSNDDYPEKFKNAFIEDGKLCAFHDINIYMPVNPQTTLLIYDLSNGVCTVTKLPDTVTFCPYTAGKLLSIQDNTSTRPDLAVYDVSSGQLTKLDIVFPISIERRLFAESWFLHSEIGGLAYDEARDIIYLADVKGLWRSTKGAPFERVDANDIWEMMTCAAEAWVLSSGGYVTQNGLPYYVKTN